MDKTNLPGESVSAEVLDAVERVLAGDSDAYSVIVSSYMQKLYRTALSLSGRAHTAEDLVQETLIDGYLKLGTLRDREKIGSWLVRILKNKYLNLVMRSPRLEPEEAAMGLADRRSPEMLYCARESLDGWRERLHSLSPALRETAILYFWHHLTMEQISARLHLPLGTVKCRIHDAREQLKKENGMDNMTKLPDNFLETVQKKVDELAKYHKIYGTMDGFDKAYEQVKELIGNLSYAEDVKKFTVKSSMIAYNADEGKYQAEALENARKYGDVMAFGDISLDICWKLGSDAEKLKYTVETILPALENFPDSRDKIYQRGNHLFWMAHYTDKSTDEGKTEAERLLAEALDCFRKLNKPNALYGNTVSGMKALRFLQDDRYAEPINVCLTGERWLLKEGGLYYSNQPGCNYAWSEALCEYDQPVFYFAGWCGDRYFFPRTIPLEAGAREEMLDNDGESCGWREIVSMDDTVETPAGTFTGCMHLRKTEDESNVFDIWYKDGVGIVKEVARWDGFTGDTHTEVLVSCEIKGGDGYLPLAVGNTWRYERPDRPEVIHELNEYVIEQLDDEAVSLSCINFAGLVRGWEELTNDGAVLLTAASQRCTQKDFEGAAAMCRRIIIENQNQECTAYALGVLEYLEEKIPYDKQGWRFCPSSINGSYVNVVKNKITYTESAFSSMDTGPWGTRGEENGIFGVKPFRFLQTCAGGLWDNRWVPGFSEERVIDYGDKAVLRISVDDGGTVETPAGVFENCLHLVIDGEVDGVVHDYTYYFYSHTHCGHKEFWFAPGVGVVRFVCDWGGFVKTDCVLSSYKTVAKDREYMPVYLGSRWQYDELGLTNEGYIARRDYKVASGMNGRYLLVDNQMFTFRGDVEAYDAFKRSLTEEK
ncbi:MAG: sigma-70 family RNA polymerase sigma factor [Clostridia bacterium]|nr:sigma-70 family RNA polymerase sigma factor [Clostridia bacterium]